MVSTTLGLKVSLSGGVQKTAKKTYHLGPVVTLQFLSRLLEEESEKYAVL